MKMVSFYYISLLRFWFCPIFGILLNEDDIVYSMTFGTWIHEIPFSMLMVVLEDHIFLGVRLTSCFDKSI
jgi:hypothetical protein